MESQLILITKEDLKVPVSNKFASISGFVKNVTEDFAGDIKVNISKQALDFILEYAEHHHYCPPVVDKPIPSNNMREVVKDPWDFEFLNKIQESFDVVELIMAANYMDVYGLLQLLLAFIASRYKMKDINKFREKYNITDEFNEEEDRKIMRENPWAAN